MARPVLRRVCLGAAVEPKCGPAIEKLPLLEAQAVVAGSFVGHEPVMTESDIRQPLQLTTDPAELPGMVRDIDARCSHSDIVDPSPAAPVGA